jgi:hypothetical protein
MFHIIEFLLLSFVTVAYAQQVQLSPSELANAVCQVAIQDALAIKSLQQENEQLRKRLAEMETAKHKPEQ